MTNKIFENGFNIKKEMLSNSEDLREKLSAFIKETVRDQFRKDGLIIGVSGGIDSAVIPLWQLTHWVRTGSLVLSSLKRSLPLRAGNWG
jgi:hypothetical protein